MSIDISFRTALQTRRFAQTLKIFMRSTSKQTNSMEVRNQKRHDSELMLIYVHDQTILALGSRSHLKNPTDKIKILNFPLSRYSRLELQAQVHEKQNSNIH